MSKKETYIKELETNLENYKNKISKIENLLEDYKGSNKRDLLNQKATLQEKFDDGKKMLKKIQAASEQEYEKMRESAGTIFESIKEAFYDFSHFLTLEQLARTKKELTQLGGQTVDEAQDIIKHHPLAIAAGALGLGFIVGTLLARSK